MSKQKQRKVTTVTVTDDAGNSHRKSVSYHSSKELAEKTKAFEKEILAAEKPLFEAVAHEWWKSHESKIEHYTMDSYKAPYKNVVEEFGTTPIADIKSLDIQRFLNRLAAKGYAKQTINLRKIVLNLIYTYAVYQDITHYNPVPVCSVSKNAPKTTRQLPTDADIEKITASPPSQMRTFALTLMYTGLRKEEALALDWNAFDLDNNTIAVNQVAIFESSSVTVIRNHMKSTAGKRIIPLLAVLKNELVPGKGFVFSQLNGEPYTKGTFDNQFNKFRKQLNITCTCHQLRHWYSTFCYDAGVSEKELQHLLGHSKVTTSLDIYTHIREERMTGVADKLNRSLIKKCSQSVVNL